MTTFEHVMLGIHGTLAAGLHRRYGWRIVALAGIAAIAPDCDGLAILGGVRVFDQAHRAWGHSLLPCATLGCILASIDFRFDLVGYGRQLFSWPLRTPRRNVSARPEYTVTRLAVWLVVATVAMMGYLAADLVYSGTTELPDWRLNLPWPISSHGFVFPLIHWGDVGVTMIFACSMFVMARWRDRIQHIALVTLTLVAAYIAIRGATC